MSKKFIIIGAVAALVLAGGGAGAFLMMSPSQAAEPAKPAQPEPPEPAPVAAPKGAYLKLDPLSAPLPVGPKGRRQMMLMLQLEIAAPSNLPKVEALMPRIRDSFIRDLLAHPTGSADGWEAADLETVRGRLLAQAARVAGPGVVSEVLIVQAVRIGG